MIRQPRFHAEEGPQKLNCLPFPPRYFGSRGTPSKIILFTHKNICAKFGACTRFVTIIPLSERTILYLKLFLRKLVFGVGSARSALKFLEPV